MCYHIKNLMYVDSDSHLHLTVRGVRRIGGFPSLEVSPVAASRIARCLVALDRDVTPLRYPAIARWVIIRSEFLISCY